MRIGDGSAVDAFTALHGKRGDASDGHADQFAALLTFDDERRPSLASASASRPTWGKQDSAASATQKFLDFMAMDPIERLRARILESMGLDESSLAAMPPAERKAVEDEIAKAVQRVFGVGEGSDVEGAAASDQAIAS